MSLFSDRRLGISLLTRPTAVTITSSRYFGLFHLFLSHLLLLFFLGIKRNLVTLSRKWSKVSIFCHFVNFVNFHPLPAIAGRPDHMESKFLEKIELLVYQTHMGVAGEGNYSSLDLLCKFTKEGL